jgi:NTE family protein
MESIRKLIIENIPHNSFEKLKIRLFVNVTDFNHNKVIFFSEGKLMDCLIASASVPVLFNPVEYDHSLLVDGGLLNNFPAATIGFL